MDLNEAARRVHLGRSILFTGAGFSIGATSYSGKPLTDAIGLAKDLSESIGEDETLPLDLAADGFIEKHGNVQPLIRRLQDTFMVKDFQLFHSDISKLPWNRVYTTNYDNLFEECRRRERQTPSVATLSERPVDVLEAGLIVHLNGFVERLSPSSWDNDLILTTSQYLSDKVTRSPWAEVFRSDLSLSDAVFFMGYSLYDLDVARLLFENPDIIRKTFFVVGEAPKRATVLTAKRFGEVISQNVSSIAAAFPAVGSIDAPIPSPFPVSLRKFIVAPSLTPPNSDDVVRFITKGDVTESYVARSVLEGVRDYYVSRSEISGVVDVIERGKGRIILHSDLGNGKTTMLIEIAVLLHVAGYTTFYFNGSTGGIHHDIEFLGSFPMEERRKVVVVIEEGFAFTDLVKTISRNLPEIGLIVSARSAALETRLGSVIEAFGDDYAQFDLNGLSTEESTDFSLLLLNHGLWGDKQGWSEQRRLKFIERNCRKHLSALLLSVCRSTQIFQRLRDLLKNVDELGERTFESLLTVLSMSYAGQDVSVSQVCEIVQADLFKTSRAQGSEILREF
jgi:hypothetical protein